MCVFQEKLNKRVDLKKTGLFVVDSILYFLNDYYFIRSKLLFKRITLSFLSFIFFTLSLYLTIYSPPVSDSISTCFNFPSSQSISTVHAPLALIPFIEPIFHDDGKAGSKYMYFISQPICHALISWQYLSTNYTMTRPLNHLRRLIHLWQLNIALVQAFL